MAVTFKIIGLVVSDMARSLAFYRQLGVEVPEADDQPHVEAPIAEGVRLAFDTAETVRSYDPSWIEPAGGGHRIGLAFRCDGPAEVDRVYADLVGAGYEGHREPWDAFWGQRYAVIHDPDGNSVELFAPLPAMPG
jgi:catechol 2,3-dioxygenase-like lactoylglutathione lyase family enzyme